MTEYYLKHRPGQTFSAYWRARLREAEAAKVGEGDYRPSTWVCERCEHRHRGEDPPVFCPGCAGVRRLFARLEDDEPAQTGPGEAAGPPAAAAGREPPPAAPRDDGFVFAARADALREGSGLEVEVAGQSCVLFRVNGEVHALEGRCPHAGGPLAEGTLSAGVVTCPWHGWRFDACSGCSVEPPGNDVARYETRVEAGAVLVRPPSAPRAAARRAQRASAGVARGEGVPVNGRRGFGAKPRLNDAAHGAPRRERRGAPGSPQADAGGSGRSSV